ncbi:MAG: hypothetical protein WBW27_24010 [Pseudolabrys sp.]|jgi:hypothetical protein
MPETLLDVVPTRGQSDFGSVPRLEPRDRQIIDLGAHAIFLAAVLIALPQ